MQNVAINTMPSQSQVAGMCHEILTPLTTILGVSQILLNPLCPTQKHMQCVTALRASALMLKELVEEMLDQARMESGNIVLQQIAFSLEDVLHEALHIMAPRAEDKGLTLSLEMEGVFSQLLGDPLRIRQILLNLLGNAVKFTSHGSIAVDAAMAMHHQGFCTLTIKVTDTGIGISEENRGRIFNEYTQAEETTQRLYGGLGLGLSISRRLAHMMHGEITVDSIPGSGSCFTVVLCLPLAQEVQQAA